MPSPRRFKEAFAVVSQNSAGVWRDLGGRDTRMAACERAERMQVVYPNRKFRVVYKKLVNKEGVYDATN